MDEIGAVVKSLKQRRIQQTKFKTSKYLVSFLQQQIAFYQQQLAEYEKNLLNNDDNFKNHDDATDEEYYFAKGLQSALNGKTILLLDPRYHSATYNSVKLSNYNEHDNTLTFCSPSVQKHWQNLCHNFTVETCLSIYNFRSLNGTDECLKRYDENDWVVLSCDENNFGLLSETGVDKVFYKSFIKLAGKNETDSPNCVNNTKIGILPRCQVTFHVITIKKK